MRLKLPAVKLSFPEALFCVRRKASGAHTSRPAMNRACSGSWPTLNRTLVRGPILLIIVTFLFFSFNSPEANAGLIEDYYNLKKKIEATKQEIARLEKEENSLVNQIAYFDNQIYLTQLEIEEAETEIKLLSEDIGDLSQRLERIASFLEFQERTFIERARSAYIAEHLSPFDIILGSDGLDEAIRRIKYLKVLEAQDREVLEQIKDVRADYNAQKALLEEKKADVEELKKKVEAKKVSLDVQRANKSWLLTFTRNEEARYQKELAYLRAEFQAITEALRNLGTALGPVTAGEPIASEGKTGCATGSHLHFSVIKNGVYVNPCSGYLGCNYNYYGEGLGLISNGSLLTPEISPLVGPRWFNIPPGHYAIDMTSGYGSPIRASKGGTAYLAQDPSWFANYCRYTLGFPYNGLGYGIVIDHGGGLKTLYWHIQVPPL